MELGSQAVKVTCCRMMHHRLQSRTETEHRYSATARSSLHLLIEGDTVKRLVSC
jgi:hypothetical protein